ncbi:SMP-30/gluconolactonase/LRE family protein [Paraburkholderia sp. Ac-20340]|uniref:SMP-30/gluconolactonase/LRE family protein n=1 Tax=Paraburkholderia sp. Ac-20340 TaxID=2703888 RepID=UPI0019805034|nr:SMP-30/gluconolactonase/LRE family protein [Paraburkholderia sp. Ac-20340]MBN3855277.1 SMP-30/gluconolactonase/LRE family protein [Paraburkholderia sp. Ac-20340]
MSAGQHATQDEVAELLVHAKNTLGEGATWCSRSARLYWNDIEGASLARYDTADQSHRTWPMPERLACFALCEDPDVLLIGLASRLAFFDLRTGEITPIVDVEPDLPVRLNDGRCDRQGRFVFGTKYERKPFEHIGGFYRLNHDLTLEKLPLPVAAIANSIGFSPDGSTMYYADSFTREIRACDYGADGTIANDRLFVRVPDHEGEPDGSTVDSDGGLWNAQWAGECVVRYGPDGVETDRIRVPTVQPTCVTLGGPHHSTLYVTSARDGLSNEALEREPHAGGVFVAQTRRTGLPEPRFQGKR